MIDRIPLPQGLTLNTQIEEVSTVDRVGFLELVTTEQRRRGWVTGGEGHVKHFCIGKLSNDLDTAVSQAVDMVDDQIIGGWLEDCRFYKRTGMM